VAAKLSAAISLVLGGWAAFAVALVCTAPAGAFAALLALLCSWAALYRENPPRGHADVPRLAPW
jgi:hypothetical protein